MVPDYELCEELVSNERFLLYRGRRRDDGTPVLLKTPHSDPASPFEVRLLEHEYEILQGLSVPGVIRVHELVRHDRGYCLVLEDRGGTPLQALLASHHLDVEAFLALATQLATIVAELHKRAIIHQHLNPWSIWLHPATGEVCLADFSLASRTVSETPTALPLSLMRSTLAYLSPEQTGRMNRLVDYRTDFYSLGVTFYELLTGDLPFRSEDALELIHNHIARMPTPPSSVATSIPEPLSQIVMKLLAKNASTSGAPSSPQRWEATAASWLKSYPRSSCSWANSRQCHRSARPKRSIASSWSYKTLSRSSRRQSIHWWCFSMTCSGSMRPPCLSCRRS
jgi:serine/threonine protein kinase